MNEREKFQSTAPVSRGRNNYWDLRRHSERRFNPRPRFPGAATSRCWRSSLSCRRFNPRPRFPGAATCGGANHGKGG